MIPDEKTIRMLWDTYRLPPNKRIHCEAVRSVAMEIAKKCIMYNAQCTINTKLLSASALLHDIDKNIEKFPEEHHPDAGVRILQAEGMDEVAEVIRTHPLHMILNETFGPTTIEQQILFIADKMTKYECIGVDTRFEMWRKEDMDEQSQAVLDKSYPKVIALRDELLKKAGMSEEELVKLMK